MSSDRFDCEIMDLDVFYNLSKEVSKRIKASGYRPDLIVGLARGGWFLARLLCDFLVVRDLVSLKVEHWGITATPDGQARLKYPFVMDLTGKRVLVVDDITDTGESMRVAVDYVKSLNPSQIRAAALRFIEGSQFIPDYYAEKIPWVWVIFPWNFTEDMCTILPKALIYKGGKLDIDRTRERLKSNFKIDVDEETIRDILDEIEWRNSLKGN